MPYVLKIGELLTVPADDTIVIQDGAPYTPSLISDDIIIKVNMTGREMCQVIADAEFLYVDGRLATPAEIWNWSPSGELYKIYEWFEIAKLKLDKLRGDDGL